MKLYYITRVNIPSLAAQSVQISSMCSAFSEKVDNFKLISTLNNENKYLEKLYEWQKIDLKTKFKYLEFTLKILKIVYKEKPTHIFTRDIVVAFMCSFFNIFTIYEAHKEPKSKVSHILINYLKNKSNFKLITISKALKLYYIDNYKYNKINIFDYHDGVFLEKYDKIRNINKMLLREELNLPKDKTIVIHTGSLYAGRGAELFEIIIKNFPTLLFVQVGGLYEDIIKWKNYYCNYNNILFVEHQKNDTLVKYQMSADLLFYPLTKKTTTWWCCSPMKMFEYMATGVPILASNIGSVGEVLTERNALIFDYEDSDTIIGQINYFINNRESVNELAIQALNDIVEYYTWEKRVKNILEFIK